MLGQIPAVAEYFTAAAVLPLALADMEVCGAATERKVLDHAVFSEAMGDYGRIRPVLREKDLLLVQPDVKAPMSKLSIRISGSIARRRFSACMEQRYELYA